MNASPDSETPAAKPTRVLLADDHSAVHALAALALEGECEIVGAVADGAALLVATARLDPDVIVLDIAMPQLDGLEAARQLRVSHPRTQLIFLTVHEDADFAQAAFAAGALGYIVKPRLASDLLAAVHAALAGKRFLSPTIHLDEAAKLFMKTTRTFLAIVCSLTQAAFAEPAQPPGMVWIPGGEFAMGSELEGSRLNEKPVVKVSVDGFWMDEHDVTNAEFRKFVEATGYKTTAERPVDWEELKKQVAPGTPKPPDEMLQPGAMVFVPTDGPVDLRAMDAWWHWTKVASWQHPEGPASNLDGREQHPVVQVSWDDAVAYAKWAGKRLPTEAEWEFASRGGLEGKRFAWGDEFKPGGKSMANTWTGNFPYKNTKEDGYAGTSPVKTYPPNKYGLYDMGGNVWNWVSDWYRPDTLARNKLEPSCHNPQGPKKSYSIDHPDQTEERVTKGGSFLCHVDYCESYRPAARRGTPPDTGMSHIGFRCALSEAQRLQATQ